MVVPDFELICEIMLVAEGFLDARLLARKFITLYSLCKELLSKQVERRVACVCLVDVSLVLLWSPYVIGKTIIFSSCFFFFLLLLLSFFSSPNLSGRRLDVYHTLAHGVALVRI